MHLAITDLFRAKWSHAIHEEWIRNLQINRPDLKPEQLQRTRALMDAHVTDALVENYESLIPTLTLPDPDDRHVLAAAIHGRADIIVTFNLNDFPTDVLSAYGIKPLHPDAFVSHLLYLAPGTVLSAVERLRSSLRHPPVDGASYLETIERQGLPETAAELRTLMLQP